MNIIFHVGCCDVKCVQIPFIHVFYYIKYGHVFSNQFLIFDFEGSMQPGIEKYFREFGGDLVPYAAIEKSSFLMTLLKAIKKK